MQTKSVFESGYVFLIIVVIFLTLIALIAEILPEIEAKLIVIPTLVTVLVLCSYDLIRWMRIKNRG